MSPERVVAIAVVDELSWSPDTVRLRAHARAGTAWLLPGGTRIHVPWPARIRPQSAETTGTDAVTSTVDVPEDLPVGRIHGRAVRIGLTRAPGLAR